MGDVGYLILLGSIIYFQCRSKIRMLISHKLVWIVKAYHFHIRHRQINLELGGITVPAVQTAAPLPSHCRTCMKYRLLRQYTAAFSLLVTQYLDVRSTQVKHYVTTEFLIENNCHKKFCGSRWQSVYNSTLVSALRLTNTPQTLSQRSSIRTDFKWTNMKWTIWHTREKQVSQ